MDNITNFEIGDFFVDSYGIYQVTDIKDEVVKDGSETFIFYKPVWNINNSNRDYTGRIPLGNTKKTGLRKMLSAKEVNNIYKNLEADNGDYSYDYNKAKEVIYQNSWDQILPLMKYLWLNRETINKNDYNLLNEAIDHLSQEIAFVTKTSLKTVSKKLMGSLDKVISKQGSKN